MPDTFKSFIESPIGKLTIVADADFISEISFEDDLKNDSDYKKEDSTSEKMYPNKLTAEAAAQLKDYFTGARTTFNFPIKQVGTAFQQEVWQKLLELPYGQTTSYAKFSSYKPLAIRAIAAANGKNNIAVVVPCHRVIGSNGKLVGYAGGLWRKKWLLEHEARIAEIGQAKFDF